MDIVERVKIEVLNRIEEYKNNSEDNYDFWNEHVKYVYEESIKLAENYEANIEIVALGALLHDIALIKKIGERKDHHIVGAEIARKILNEFDYDINNIEKVVGCVYNHRSSKNASNIEELCVADADILAHFDSIPMLFNSAFNRNNIKLKDVRNWMIKVFEKDYDDLSDRTKKDFKGRYELIRKIVLGI